MAVQHESTARFRSLIYLNGGTLGSYQEIQTLEMPNVAILVKLVADSKLNVELTKHINSNGYRFSKRA